MSTTDSTLLERITILEAENTSLRNALQHGDEAHIAYGRLLSKYNGLSKAYREMQDRNAKYRSYVDRATNKYRAAKETVKQWQEFYDHQQRKAVRLREPSAHVNKASNPVLEALDLERTPRPVLTRNVLEPSFDRPSGSGKPIAVQFEHHAAEDAFVRQVELPEQDGFDLKRRCEEESSGVLEAIARRVTSSQTTEVPSDPAESLDVRRTSDDEPEFVSARPVKRRRGNSPRAPRAATQIKAEPTSPSQPHEINSEEFSSPVLKRRQPLRKETSNLYSLAGSLDSPKKRRERRAASAEALRPPRLPTMRSSLSDGGIASDLPQPLVEEESEPAEGTTDQTVRRRDFALQPKGSDFSDRALQPLSANVTRSPRRSDAGNMKRKRKEEDSRSKLAKAAVVSEDGDMDSSQVHSIQPKVTPRPSVSRCLDSLLDEPTPGRGQAIRRTVPEKNPRPRQNQPAVPQASASKISKRSPAEKQLAEPRPTFKMPNVPPTRTVAESVDARGRPPPRQVPPQPRPEDEPLRARPVLRLGIEDFKVNPKYKGTDFAFADTLRGRDQRSCLPGCTKPECCGDTFRKAVEMGLKGKKTDDEVLEAYLGPNFANHMASRTPTEREDILIKARTYAIASEYGKHRQAFKRRASPPGFWRIDMPSTQEEEEDRTKAHEMMRQEVYDRWREAMVPRGRWVFRDE